MKLKRALDEYRHHYNARRLHQALSYRTPLEIMKFKRAKVALFREALHILLARNLVRNHVLLKIAWVEL